MWLLVYQVCSRMTLEKLLWLEIHFESPISAISGLPVYKVVRCHVQKRPYLDIQQLVTCVVCNVRFFKSAPVSFAVEDIHLQDVYFLRVLGSEYFVSESQHHIRCMVVEILESRLKRYSQHMILLNNQNLCLLNLRMLVKDRHESAIVKISFLASNQLLLATLIYILKFVLGLLS